MTPAIRVDNLTKRFPFRSVSAPAPGGAAARPEFIVALDQVSFAVEPGQSVAILGRNGAGKSTLLKILARVVRPTSGRVELRGRVGCLLEVGMGFHPDLSGRENIFLSAAMLGMKDAEIRRRFDQIVEFAGVEAFLDMAVRSYSSGMYMRLAFSVAAHMDTEILLVDEALAVGDAEFQKKCLQRLSRATADGRTILFVSHQIDAVRRLCSHALWMEHGKLMGEGPVGEIASVMAAGG